MLGEIKVWTMDKVMRRFFKHLMNWTLKVAPQNSLVLDCLTTSQGFFAKSAS